MEKKQKNLISVIVIVVALGVSGYLLTGYFNPSTLPSEYSSKGICLACQAEVTASHGAEEHAPFTCPQCGETAVYPWLYCYDCQKLFVPALVIPADGGPPRMPGHPVCSACGSPNYGSYVEGMPNQQPVGKAPLPNWPP
ncbi:MAG: hypothetical protein ABIG44_06020 [Planctomycetota bacterium]